MQTCAACFEQAAAMKQCAQCKEVHYCNATCQRVDWLRHKPSCQLSPAEAERLARELIAREARVLQLFSAR